MHHSEFIRHLNLGVIVKKNGTVVDDPTLNVNVREQRERLLNSFIFIAEVCDFHIGVKPITFVDGEKLNILWSISVLHKGPEGQFLAIDPSNINELENNCLEFMKYEIAKIEKEDLDIEDKLASIGYVQYSFA